MTIARTAHRKLWSATDSGFSTRTCESQPDLSILFSFPATSANFTNLSNAWFTPSQLVSPSDGLRHALRGHLAILDQPFAQVTMIGQRKERTKDE
jgi:hypothetical protein